MAGIALHHPQPSSALLSEGVAVMSPLYQRRGVQETGHIELLPNPDFVFPARSPEHSPSLDNWNALRRRPRSAQQASAAPVLSETGAHRLRGSVNALPSFSYNPSASASEPTSIATSSSLITPPHSPNTIPPATPSRGILHKRGGSEFIGGDGMGGAGLLSTSPTKGDPVLPPPRTSTRLGPPGGGPGHRHRRSGAISCHDLQSILQPKDSISLPRGGSAPATPLESEQKQFFTPSQRRRTLSQAEIRSSPEQSSSPGESPQARVVPRVRVGFADRVEYIRPLSTISSETEGSMSTVRGHSLSGSMSSIISNGAASPPSARMARPSLNTTFEDEDSRPRSQSSGSVLESMSKGNEEFDVGWEASVQSAVTSPSVESPPEVPSSPTSDKSSKSRSFSWWDTKRCHSGHIPSSFSEPSLLPSPPSSPDTSGFSGSDDTPTVDTDSAARKPRKAKYWPRSIISRKSKSHNNLKAKMVQDGTLPHSAFDDTLLSPNGEAFHFGGGDFEPNFDIDDTVTIVMDSQPTLNAPTWRPRDLAESDPLSPVIDLDAALGPFNTPPLGANTRGTPLRSPPRARRSMHSLGFHAGAYNPLSQMHRRTESAPELLPFDGRVSKAVPTSNMPDVFEEEGEEELEDATSGPGLEMPSMDMMSSEPEDEDGDEAGVGVHIVEVAEQRQSTQPIWHMPSEVVMDSPDFGAVSSFPDFQSHNLPQLIQRDPSPVEVVEDFEEPRASSLTQDSDATITPSLIAEDAKTMQSLNFSVPLPQQSVLTPDTLSGSSFSSPAFSTSQISLNTPRLGTATSSDTNSRSFSFGEPGPAVRMSVDDVPSLSSSRSTMTTPPQNPFAVMGPHVPNGRTSSVFSTPSVEEPHRGTKRSSIASLSMLVGSTFGEKSKLSIESRPQSQHIMSTTASKKKKKTNRLSKLIHFWKKPSESTRV